MEIKNILNERGNTHGDFSDNAYIAQELKKVVRTGSIYNAMTAVQMEAIDMILHKIARAVSGNPNHKDHWDDIAGYATLVSERIETPALVFKTEDTTYVPNPYSAKTMPHIGG